MIYKNFLIICLFVGTFGYVPQMLLGRPRGGFVGAPDLRHKYGDNLESIQTPPEKYFLQKLNHFDGSDTRTWNQRFFVNNTFYERNGPLFVQIGGEGTANPIWMVEGAWIDYCKKYKALCVLLEHRYYGKSHPTSDLKDENLIYLSSEQALADLAHFITSLSSEMGHPKVITFGGSYPGSLSAWFRMKYPHIVHGAVASSAPLEAKVNFKEYFKVVDDSLRTYDVQGDSCNKAIISANSQVEEHMKTLEGRMKIRTQFRLCDAVDPNILKDVSNFYNTLAGNFAGVVQYNKDNRAFEGGKGGNITIDTLCDIMTKSEGSSFDAYAKVSNLLLDTHGQKCLDYKYDKMVDSMRQTEWSSSAAEGGRQWTYQTCTEFAFYQSSDYQDQPFGHNFPVNFFLDLCADIFGKDISNRTIRDAVARSNTDYGALAIRITRVLFPNGSIDPWHALGVLRDLNPEAKAIFINGTAHCANMYPPSPNDPADLVKARQEIETTIGQWLQS